MDTYFTPDNWNHCQYRHENQFAIISLVADGGESEAQITYCVTVLDDEHNEIYQSQHPDLMQACQQINSNYSDIWEFKDLRSNQNSGGCSTCQAH